MKKVLEWFVIVMLYIAAGVGLSIAIKHQIDNPSFSKLECSIERTINSVVHITNETQRWQGSGVVVTEDIIMTARHVVENGVDFTITLNNGYKIKATRAISSKKHDLGFIKLDELILSPVEFGSIEDCKLGQSVYVIGSPYGKLNFNNVTLGIVSGLNRDCDEFGEDYGWSIAFTTDSAGHPGNSGCPVFTMDGVVRGILVGGHSPVLVYCIPVDLVLEDIDLIEMMFLQNKYEFEELTEDSQENWLIGPGIGEQQCRVSIVRNIRR